MSSNDSPPSDETWLSLGFVARLFRQDPRTIKRRAMEGDFELKVDGRGKYFLSKKSVDTHIRELEERHARRG